MPWCKLCTMLHDGCQCLSAQPDVLAAVAVRCCRHRSFLRQSRATLRHLYVPAQMVVSISHRATLRLQYVWHSPDKPHQLLHTGIADRLSPPRGGI